jgi:peptidoglycan/xylan/chitin deacetylase (PgdA/CDA1 family)
MVRGIASLLLLVLVQAPVERQVVREVAITFDDLPVASVIDREGTTWSAVTEDLLGALSRHKVPATGFVNEQKVVRAGKPEPALTGLLNRWLLAGMDLGNHGYSHLDFHSADVEVFQRDILRGEELTRPLLKGAGKQLQFFRHPFLHTGRTLEARRALERFLSAHGYRVAPVTIDNYDYVFAAAYERTSDAAFRARLADEYLRYIEAVVAYYEQQSVAIVGREIRQILLLHANTLNAKAFDGLAGMLSARGYRFVSLEQALSDPAYSLADTYVGPSGMTWLHRWALSQGKRGAIFAGEPRVPDWVEQAALPQTKG